MMRVSIQDASRAFLEGMAKSLSRTIDAGVTHNEDGLPLQDLLNEVIEQIPLAPEYTIEHRRRR
jgi:hypothetical protein